MLGQRPGGIQSAKDTGSMLELVKVLLGRLLEVELLDQPAIGVDEDHPGLHRDRDDQLLAGAVEHDWDHPAASRGLGDLQRRGQAEEWSLLIQLLGLLDLDAN